MAEGADLRSAVTQHGRRSHAVWSYESHVGLTLCGHYPTEVRSYPFDPTSPDACRVCVGRLPS